jgi:outer membrane immunogenic protein
MLKKILLGSVAAISMTASAYAADLPRRAPPPMLPPPPVFTWTGFYLGVNGGGAWTQSQQNLPFVETFGGAFFFAGDFGPLRSRSGVFGGGQGGFNWQTGPLVFGVEMDAQGSRITSNSATTIAPYLTAGNAASIATTQRIDYFGTARGRVGITFGGPGWGPGPGWGSGAFGGPVLVYATGGFAYAGVRDAFAYTDTFGFSAFNSGNNGRYGFAAGGGIEWMFLPNWSIKGEYQYIALRAGPRAAATEFVGGVGTAFVINRVDPRIAMHTARIGLNYHFGWAPPPAVVARY